MAQIRLHVYQADGYLPAVCMCCGRPATTTTTKRMSWHPAWVGGLAAMIMTKYATVQAPFCDEHKGHWFKRALLLWGSLLLFGVIAVGALVVGVNLERRASEMVLPIVGVGCGVLLVAWIIIAIVCQYTAIRTTEITDEEVSLTGVSEEFVEAVAEEERARRKRRAERRRERGRWRDEDDDDDEDEPRRPSRRRD
jgi:hypothetical protein